MPKNNCYKAGDETYQQMNDGLKGPDIQRALCQCVMIRWNDKIVIKCKHISENSEDRINVVPKLIQTYVEDQKTIVEELLPVAEQALILNIYAASLQNLDNSISI